MKRSTNIKQRHTGRTEDGIALAQGAIETAGVINQALALTEDGHLEKYLKSKLL